MADPTIAAALDAPSKLLMSVDPWVWAYWGNMQLPDARFRPEGNEQQIGYMQSQAQRKCVRKATQFAFSTSEVIDALHGCRYGRYPKGVIYLFPTRNDVADFSSSRFKPILAQNHKLIGQFVRDTDRENLKRIGQGFLFFRSGSLSRSIQGQQKTSTALKSIPGDKVVFDEYDEMTPGARGLAIKRMEDSDLKKEVYLANPTLPDYGIDAIYERESDRRVWLHRCPGCRRDCVLEDDFPDCLQTKPDGTAVRVCVKCGHVINPNGGDWVARNPDKSEYMEGYWISHLNKTKTNPADILLAWSKIQTGRTSSIEIVQFWNLVMGLGYVDAQNRLSVQQVLALCSDSGMASADVGPCSMGVDQGNHLHVVIGKEVRVLYLGIHTEWEELDRLMKNFTVTRCVVDAMPEIRNARAFAQRFKGRVWLNYYNDHQHGSYRWDERRQIVTENRTESLDNSHMEIERELIKLPRNSDLVQAFASHMHNVAKKLEEDPETGSKRYTYVRLAGEDHFRHAFNYFCVAKSKPPGFFEDCDLS